MDILILLKKYSVNVFFCPPSVLRYGCVHQLGIFLNVIFVSLRYYKTNFIRSFLVLVIQYIRLNLNEKCFLGSYLE